MENRNKVLQMVKNSKFDYHIFNRIEETLELDIDNHAKANFLIDIIYEEVEKIIEDVYDEGYYEGEDCAKENHVCEECEELRDTLDRIVDIARGW